MIGMNQMILFIAIQQYNRWTKHRTDTSYHTERGKSDKLHVHVDGEILLAWNWFYSNQNDLVMCW